MEEFLAEEKYNSEFSSISSPLKYHADLDMIGATRTYLDDGFNKPLNFDYSSPHTKNKNLKVNFSPFEKKSTELNGISNGVNHTDLAESKYTFQSTHSNLYSSRKR